MRSLPNAGTSFTIDSSRQPADPCCTLEPFMKIHEYQAKAIFRKYGVAVPQGEMATTRDEAEGIAKRLFSEGKSGVVVKAQIHAGGRGKGGGVKVANNMDEAATYINAILGMQL